MLGIHGKAELTDDGTLIRPAERFGLRALSIAMLMKNADSSKTQPVILRAPMIVKTLDQMLRQVAWGELDVLVLDLPPGTGDVQLSLAQRVALTGAVIVSTPQEVALQDVRRAITMFNRVGVPVLGLVENMSEFVCAKCGHASQIFGPRGGTQHDAHQLNTPLLAQLPLTERLRESCDNGTPITISHPHQPDSLAFLELAQRIIDILHTNNNTNHPDSPTIETV
eukprot:CAMPEP_0185848778 /NCGR_PEP_ID=MMETSP1354-20130828/3525_1 /TAXON_ID=708628 /ORGANISM="Erythrolobus madagascarensis, Strain CCMP3276" /LENGTH=223 /DNA_ID=CAMNT_0028549217 /DNA_START=176 /DNA_END=847 /DNA_ORIENTATION=+